MIIIDGRTSDINVSNFANLEEVLTNVVEDGSLDNRIVTDVLINDEAFSELYPHQAEDIETSEIEKIEIRSVSIAEMASDVTTEMYKVITLMDIGGKRCAELLRQAELSSGLEVLQDIVDVTRHFLAMVELLRSDFARDPESSLDALTGRLDSALGEMNDVLAQEDWFLLADLLEFEYLPVCIEWNAVLGRLAQDIAEFKAA